MNLVDSVLWPLRFLYCTEQEKYLNKFRMTGGRKRPIISTVEKTVLPFQETLRRNQQSDPKWASFFHMYRLDEANPALSLPKSIPQLYRCDFRFSPEPLVIRSLLDVGSLSILCRSFSKKSIQQRGPSSNLVSLNPLLYAWSLSEKNLPQRRFGLIMGSPTTPLYTTPPPRFVLNQAYLGLIKAN